MRQQEILDNQRENVHLLRGITANSVTTDQLDIKDLILQSFLEKDELDDLCEKIKGDATFKMQLQVVISTTISQILNEVKKY